MSGTWHADDRLPCVGRHPLAGLQLAAAAGESWAAAAIGRLRCSAAAMVSDTYLVLVGGVWKQFAGLLGGHCAVGGDVVWSPLRRRIKAQNPYLRPLFVSRCCCYPVPLPCLQGCPHGDGAGAPQGASGLQPGVQQGDATGAGPTQPRAVENGGAVRSDLLNTLHRHDDARRCGSKGHGKGEKFAEDGMLGLVLTKMRQYHARPTFAEAPLLSDRLQTFWAMQHNRYIVSTAWYVPIAFALARVLLPDVS